MRSFRPCGIPASYSCKSLTIFISLSWLAVSCNGATPKFSEAGVSRAAAPGADAVASKGDPDSISDPSLEESSNEAQVVDDHTPDDKGEVGDDAPALKLSRWSFEASSYQSGRLNYSALNKELSQAIVLDNNVLKSEQTFAQKDRPVITELFAQGSDLHDQTESFKQNPTASGLLDLLVVVDNSGSMVEEQQNLSSKLSPLLSFVQNSDWRIGVVTTDPKDGCLRGLIGRDDPNASTLFTNAIQAGIKGSGNERGILQAVNGLKGECNTTGSWVRPQSTVAVLIVSDEDNCSAGQDCGTDPWAAGSYLTNYLSSIRQPGLNARVYGLIGHPSLTSAQCKTMASKANIYASVIDETGGTWGSICDSDYSNTLESISKDISVILLTQFTLKHSPLPGSLKVLVNGVAQTSGFTLHDNVVEFQSPPAVGKTIDISYRFNSIAPTAEFALREAADPASLKVYLDSVETKAFHYEASKNTIVFDNAPKVDGIKAIYRRGEVLSREFKLEDGGAAVALSVRVNGTVLPSSAYSYKAAESLLTLTSAPIDGAKILVNFDKVLSHRLDYPLLITADQAITAWDAVTGKSINSSRDGDRIVFAETDYSPGRSVIVKSTLLPVWKITLINPIDRSTLKVNAGAKSCEDFSLIDGILDLKNCAFASNEKVEVNFEWEAERRDLFDLAMSVMPPASALWKVKVNGQSVTDYSLENSAIRIGNLPAKAQIEVSVAL